MNEDLDKTDNLKVVVNKKIKNGNQPYPEEYAVFFDQDEAMEKHPEQVLRADILCRLIDGKAHEVAASMGYITNKAKVEYGRDITCSDISPLYAKRAKELHNIDMDIADVQELPYDDEEFDTIIAGETIEHFEDFGKVFSELIRCAKKRILFSIPISQKFENDPTHAWQFRLHNITNDIAIFECIKRKSLKEDFVPTSIMNDYKKVAKEVKNKEKEK